MLERIFEEAIEAGLIQKRPIEELIASFYCILDGNVFQMFFYHDQGYEKRLKIVWNTFWLGLINEKLKSTV
ncbi:hypothetical protein [Halalkalibacter urbisdiaboli]|uniref:hypothetical protein n=1 Tax=Halalkalibacter urbisdiaboli TaxID=1960589 RepID=UPI000B44831E|nr:hypothetical protein [Halalkalibacter urbisdiaboli]